MSSDVAIQVLEDLEKVHAKQWVDRRGHQITSFPAYNIKMQKIPFEPLHITFSMKSPIAVTDYIHFDALIWHAVIEENLGMAFWNQTGEENYDTLLPLMPIVQSFHREKVKHWQTGEPLAITRKYYACSVGFYEKGFVEGVTAWRKRCDFPPELGKVDLKRGLYKAYDMPLTYVSAPEVTFYAVGNKEEIEKLLTEHISHIGKKRSQGYGYISKIVIKTIKSDYSVFRDKTLQRPIPAEGCPHQFAEPLQAYYAYRPPYWRIGNLTPCYMPGSK